MSTNNLEFYTKLAAQLQAAKENDLPPLEDGPGALADYENTIEVDGVTYKLHVESNDQRAGEDSTTELVIRVNDTDEYAVGISGYYSSWDGTDWSHDSFFVGKRTPITVYYVSPVKAPK